MEEEKINKTGLFDYICVKNKNLSIVGNTYSPRYRFINLYIDKCNNNTFKGNNKSNSCKSDSEINTFIKSNGVILNFAVIDSYFDGSDYEHPIKYHINDKYFYFLDPSQEKWTGFYLKENQAVLYDNVISNLLAPPKNETFFKLS